MEFEHVGRHCSLSSCRQQDFLPFECDYCHGSFCLEHRLYHAHGCAGAVSKDMTSIDCPICLKSVKFDKSQDINLIWNEHYATSCTQTSTADVKNVTKCARTDCRNHLGPSNTWTCTKCLKKVCLSHRLPEDHQCSTANKSAASLGRNNIRGGFLDRIEAQQSVAKKPTVKPSTASGKGSAKSTSTAKTQSAVDDRNSLRGTAQRRIKQDATNNAMLSCPFCNLMVESPDWLQTHINEAHPDPPSTSSRPLPAQSTGGSEVCPMCSARFLGAVSLIEHCEAVHNSSQTISGNDGSYNNSRSVNNTQNNCRIV